ncbi:hypothetical protein BJV43_002997 [Clostridium saccharoperbutylacetonicum]|nr:hypothetical protein [Clostridium saccharoperbutylacetonicum]
MKKRITLLLALVMTTTFALTSCATKANTKVNVDSDVIKIGVFEPMTGANAAGESLKQRELNLLIKFIQRF